MSLEIEARTQLGDFSLAAAFATDSRVTAIFGPSGAGKTTLVNVIAGLVRPKAGLVSVDGAVLLDTARGIDVPPHARRIGYVFQDARLFPHLSVRQNLLYGQWFAPRDARRTELDDVSELLDLAPLFERATPHLSGGEKQRVAIGRALLSSPRLLLLDEPLASLDHARKAEVMPFLELLRDHARVKIVYVSHSVAEVKRLASTVVLMRDGRVVGITESRDLRIDGLESEIA
jgi:molybdate transport system ATP-binding protein